MTMPDNPHAFSGDHVTEATEPHRVRKHAPLRDRLVQGGKQPYAMPEQMTGALAVLQGLVGDATELLRALNDSPILFAGVVRITADGCRSKSFDVQYRCVSVANLTGATITVATGGRGDPANPPTEGAGVHIIPAGAQGSFAMMGNELTLYGPAAGQVDLAVATRWVPGL